MNRSEFLSKLSIIYLSYSYLVKKATKIDLKNPVSGKQSLSHASPESISAPNSNYFIDMHCHPCLKFYLWGEKIWQYHPSKKGINIMNLQVDVNKVLAGNVKGLMVAHYLPEKGLKEQSKKLHKLIGTMQFFAPVLKTKIEQGNSANFKQLSVMLDEFEKQVEIANNKIGIKRTGKDIIKIARSYEEFENNINAGIISIAQTIEGSHALGRDMNANLGQDYLTNLDSLFERGICLVTLAHFFQNDLCFPVECMPPWDKAKLKFTWNYDPESDNKPLTSIGKGIVIRMLEKGMIVDITHLTPCARSEVFLINEMFNRPIVFSHTGVQGLFNGPKEFENLKFYCASDEEIDKIKKCNGIIGLIFVPYFLTGRDTHMREGGKQMANVIDHLIATIQYIKEKTGTYNNVAIGSDFDNFYTAPEDLKDASFFPVLLERIKKIPFISKEEIDMITHGNALRVLREGWKR